MYMSSFPTWLLTKTVTSLNTLVTLVKNQLTINVGFYLRVLCFIPLICMLTVMPVSHSFDDCSFMKSFQIGFISIFFKCNLVHGLLCGSVVKNPPAKQDTQVQSLGLENPLEKEIATHSSILAWEIPLDRGAWRAIVHGVANELNTT